MAESSGRGVRALAAAVLLIFAIAAAAVFLALHNLP